MAELGWDHKASGTPAKKKRASKRKSFGRGQGRDTVKSVRGFCKDGIKGQ